ncbi:MAG: hypothetical protein QW701_03175 [Candidatus Nezhaarchaeales archaeon]
MAKRSSFSRVIDMLRALNCFYSLRDLEEVLDVPFQNLWRYVNLLSVPEEKTIEKIMSRVRELKLIEETIGRVLSDPDVDIWSLAREPGFLRLFSLVIEELAEGLKVDVIVPLSYYALPLASVVAMDLETAICPVTTYGARSEREGFYTAHYISSRDGELRMIAIPRRSLHGRERALLIDVVVDDLNLVEAVVGVIKRAKIEEQLLVAIQMAKEVRLKLEESKQELRIVKVFKTLQ